MIESTPPTPNRRLVLSVAAATLLAGTSGCVRVRSPRREADPEHYNSYDVTLRADSAIMTQVASYSDPDDPTSIPEYIIINSSFRTSEEGRATFDALTVETLGLRGGRFVDEDGTLNPSRASGVLRGIETDDVLVEVQFPASSYEDGAAVNYLITVRRTEQPTTLVPRSTPGDCAPAVDGAPPGGW